MYNNIEDLIQQESWLSRIQEYDFEDFALSLFHYQVQYNQIYRDFVHAIGCDLKKVDSIVQIPFLPILFFKTYPVKTGSFDPELIFESSGTTTTTNSKHLVRNAQLYRESFLLNFKESYGDPADYVFLCLLPSYLERGNSSLVYMADDFIRRSQHPESGFYLHDFVKLSRQLQDLQNSGKKVILLGVTFALLDFAEEFPMDLSAVIVMETGGMKGRREEWSREQVHNFLKEKWNLSFVHSEYGMTELLSQAYSKGNGIFQQTNLLRAVARAQNDPFELSKTGNGCLNIIDLANVHSCSFIATDDLVRIHENLDFEILGRLDNSALRGCSLMAI